MKAYRTDKPDSTPLLFRPDMNMARMKRSAARVRLPVRVLPFLFVSLSRYPPPSAFLAPFKFSLQSPSTTSSLAILTSSYAPFLHLSVLIALIGFRRRRAHQAYQETHRGGSTHDPSSSSCFVYPAYHVRFFFAFSS